MTTKIYCKATSKGIHSFYLIKGTEEYFLFCQPYRKGVESYYGRGVLLNEAMNYSKAHNDSAITRTMSKIPMYLRYVEKECSIEVLERKKMKYARRKKKCA